MSAKLSKGILAGLTCGKDINVLEPSTVARILKREKQIDDSFMILTTIDNYRFEAQRGKDMILYLKALAVGTPLGHFSSLPPCYYVIRVLSDHSTIGEIQ
jgi:hypothetical protein